MSKIGRKAIPLTLAKAEVNGSKIIINGPKARLEHELPSGVSVALEGNELLLTVSERTRENKMLWGLHRALLANKVIGAEKGFERIVRIVGLGFKAQLAGRRLNFSLGFSHKIDYDLPQGVDVEVDKSGQLLTFRSVDKFLLGNACDKVRSFRPPEPYKGTGVIRDGEKVRRKAGKAKSS